MFIDPPRVFGLAKSTRGHAATIGQAKPLSGGTDAQHGADCEVTRNLRDGCRALNDVLQYHVNRLNHFADLADRAAHDYIAADQQAADELRRAKEPVQMYIPPAGNGHG